MIPGWSRNWFRTSTTTCEAARPTARIASEENRNATAPPISRPTSTSGRSTRMGNSSAFEPIAPRTASANEPNSEVAAITAVAIAIPFVIAFVEFPTASKPVEHLRGTAFELPGHLGDALRVVRDRAVGVHRDDHADGREHPHPGQRDEVERLCGVVAEDEGADDHPGDHEDRPDGGLEPDREAGEDRRRRSRLRRLRDLLHRLVLRVGEVLREDLDDAREDQAEQDGDRRPVARSCRCR